jgi:DNA-binding MarR family transcriptional regulator
MLRAACEWPGSGVRELARRTRTDAMNAKRLADHLEQLGLLRSVTDPAHRQRRVLCATEKGVVLAREIAERAAVWNRQLTRLLGAAESAQLLDLLERLETALGTDPGNRPTHEEGPIQEAPR